MWLQMKVVSQLHKHDFAESLLRRLNWGFSTSGQPEQLLAGDNCMCRYFGRWHDAKLGSKLQFESYNLARRHTHTRTTDKYTICTIKTN